MNRAWPGWDGGVLIGLDLLAIGLWWFTDQAGMGPPVTLLCALTALWLGVTLWSRRSATPVEWRGAWRGFPAGWQLYLTLLAWGGRRPVQWALVPLVVVYWVFLRGPQRDGIRAYLTRRLPEATVPQRAWAHFQLLTQFAFSLVDRFHLLLHGSKGLTFDRSRIPGLQAKVYGEEFAGEGLLVLSGHLGNADFASTALHATQREVSIVLHRTPTDPYFALLTRTGEEAHSTGAKPPNLLAVNDAGRMASVEILRRLRDGQVVAMKADRAVDGRVAEVDFLGGKILLPTGPFLLAALSGAPVLLLGCFRTADLVYCIEAVGPRRYRFQDRKRRDEDLQRWAQEFAHTLEEWTERYPLQWFNFFDPWADALSTPDPDEGPS